METLATIQKYPNPQQSQVNVNHQLSNMRMSMHSINHFGGGVNFAGGHHGGSPPSIGKISHSSVYSGGILHPQGS